MTHFEVDPGELQRDVPFSLDLRDGRAFVTLVTFKLRGMRPRLGGKPAEWIFRPIATHEFLNVRTYVSHDGEPGIHFLAEWLSSRLASGLGRSTFSLPYHHGRFTFEGAAGGFTERIADARSGDGLTIKAAMPPDIHYSPCEAGSLDEWLMERYSAFNSGDRQKRFFRVWHPPWRQCPVEATVTGDDLLTANWPWFRNARLVGANFSRGIAEVWMGRPHSVLNAE
jgi:uncharacterized protein YqjF (DUF2071 family)